MATSQTTPIAIEVEIRKQKTGFDLESKSDVTVVKVGKFVPVSDMNDFVARLGNDSGKILTIVNSGLQDYEREQLAANPNVPWQVEEETEDANGVTSKVLVPFEGSLLSEEKSAQLAANVLNMAKMLFGYAKEMVSGKGKDAVDANRKAKADAKAKAQEMLLSNPAVIEALKK